MSNITKAERIEKIVKKMNEAEVAYYKGQPIMSDFDYDSLENELKTLAPQHPKLKKVGCIPDRLKASLVDREDHGMMGSLNKSVNFKELAKWVNDHPAKSYFWSPKIDGLALELVYRDHELKGAYTRGDGMTGEDVTKAVLKMDDIPHFVESNALWVIRGELYFSKKDFEDLNRHLRAMNEEPYKNPRNFAVGMIRAMRCSHELVPHLKLKFRMWKVVKGSKKIALTATTVAEQLKMASARTGIKAVPFKTLHLSQFNDYPEIFANYRKESEFPMDGITVGLNDLVDTISYGENQQGTPYWMTAYKFPPMRKSTVVKAIKWNVGRTGRLCPVVYFEPVLLDGSQVSSATGDNYNEIKRLRVDVGRTVFVEKGGDIIPQIVRTESEVESEQEAPAKCPVCEGKVEEFGRNLFCRNKYCPAQVANRLENFCKIFTMDGFGSSAIASISPMLKTLSALFTLEGVKLVSVMGHVKGRKLFGEIQNIKDHPQKLSKVLEALGMLGVGKETAKKIALAFKSPKELIECGSKEEIAILLGSVGFKGIAMRRLSELLWENIKELEQLSEVLHIVSDLKKSKNLIFDGKVFLITGTLTKPRKEFESLIESNGGRLASSVVSGLNYLILGDGGKEAKAEKARKIGAQVISEQDLIDMIER